ncbi:MAG TPA: hydrogenase 2 operon protein HybA [Myxococcales bacterium]|nr:hydrogenase 2 operon protein HybA [Myxococcales bacterium]
MDRRNFLKSLALAGGAAAAAPAIAHEKEARPESKGMLYDSTRCIGCKACVVACREANNLPPAQSDGLHDVQQELNGTTKNVIKLYKDPDDPSVFAFMKQQCMHCVDPACTSACMLGALKKTAEGPVTYDKSSCIGCRYCQVACPFNVPKFEWYTPVPKIVKCELCPERTAQGKLPACVDVCPRQAVIYGTREELLKEAHLRLEKNPKLYQPKVYGEHDLGGTNVLYLSAVPFTKLGLPEKGDRSGASVSETVQEGVYQSFITPLVLYGGLAATVFRNWKKGRKNDDEGGEEEEAS